MHTPAAFRVDDLAKLHAQIERTPLAILISQGEQGPQASHLPLLLDRQSGSQGTLYGHFSRANPQWRSLGSGQALVIFAGPSAYVSPGYYPSKTRDHKAVPTWNYVAVHAYGQAEVFDEPARLRELVGRLSDQHEQNQAQPWSLDDAPADYLDAMLRGIVGFALPIERLEGTWKLSQNHSAENFGAVREALAASTQPGERQLAQLMDELR